MPTYFSPTGNPEVWEEKPNGYFTPEDWETMHPEPSFPEPTVEERLREIIDAIQLRLDNFAQTRNYDNILSAASYSVSTDPKFKAEGEYAVLARDLTWTKGYEILAEFESGQRPMPTVDEVLAELPVLEWSE